jgi:hypothetical protein
MPLSPSEAAETLRDINLTARRSANVYGYQAAAPHLILWGIIWAIGYTGSYVRPGWSSIWIFLVIAGLIGSFWIGIRMKPTGAGYDWRFGATALAVFLFIFVLFAIMPPQSDGQAGAFFPILVALFYSLVGIWTRGMRMLLTGIALAALTVFGFFILKQYFLLWMAAVGGGGLILGGFWLRSV